jgi:hypothetical protein
VFVKQKYQSRFVAWFLSLLFIFTSLLTFPQSAFASNESDEYRTLLESRYLEDFRCVKTQAFPAKKFINSSSSGYLKDKNIRILSSQLASCVNINRLKNVDLNRLINVFSTSQVNQEKGLVGVVVAAGRKPRTPLSISTGHIENNVKVEIINFDEVDGTVVKVGTSLKIEAKASDGSNKNLNSRIVWSQNGNQIGKGKVLTYTPSQVQGGVIDLIASVPTSNGDSYAKVTFTANPVNGKWRVPPHGKYFPTDLGKSVISVDSEDPNRICFNKNPAIWKNLPSIKLGDRIIHPYDVPPRKILSMDGNCANTRIASIQEFFPEGSWKFSELMKESGKLDSNGLPLLIPSQGDLKPDKLTNQWVDFESNDPKVKRGLPKIVEDCNKNAYSMRYLARQDELLETNYNQTNQKNNGEIVKSSQTYPTYPNTFLPIPSEIMPPSNQFYQIDLKEFLEGNSKDEEVKTNYDKTDKSTKFKPQATKSKQTNFDLQAYFGFKFEPTVKGSSSVKFDPLYSSVDPLRGLSFNLNVEATEVLIGGITGSALKTFKFNRTDESKKGAIRIPTGLDKTTA